MPARTRANCQSCGKEIMEMRSHKARLMSGVDGNGKPYRFFLHQKCYDRDNAKVQLLNGGNNEKGK